MKFVLLSGGSGTRLWPLSNEDRPKQFVKILPAENGQLESMLQRTFRQLSKHVQREDIIVAANKKQVDYINEQIGQGNIVVEPCGRDTYGAILLASTYALDLGAKEDEYIAFISVDTYADDRFFEEIVKMPKKLEQTDGKLGLIGVVPQFPTSKYGYIVPDEEGNFFKVNSFAEKPDKDLAVELLQKGAVWNSGVFVIKIQEILKNLEINHFPTSYQELKSSFHLLPKNSFDYEFTEKCSSIYCKKFDGLWKDIGTWESLLEEIPQSIIGKAQVSQDTNNTYIINETKIPINVVGISNAIIVVNEHGIFITEQGKSEQIKKMIK